MAVIEIRVEGRPVKIPAVQVEGRTVMSAGRWLKIASIYDEELVEGEVLPTPDTFLSSLKETALPADIFTFAQKLPETQPRFHYFMEWDNLAVIPITTFSEWWEKRVEPSVRRAVRKAEKAGVIVRLAKLDDNFVNGIVGINNETAVRQGRRFWHFNKAFDDVKLENSTYADRNDFLGAYLGDELIGFIRLTYVDRVAHIVQLLSKMRHFDKRPANALVGKAVETCLEKGITHLVYCNYVYNDPDSSLTEFKRRNGFEKLLVPRYYVPLTPKGKICLSLGVHRGLVQRIPKPIITKLLKVRSSWYARKAAKASV